MDKPIELERAIVDEELRIDKAVLAERKRCAEIVRRHLGTWQGMSYRGIQKNILREIEPPNQKEEGGK